MAEPRTERALIACLPGDGIGPEVLDVAARVLERLPVDVDLMRLPFGGAAIDETGTPLPETTLAACRSAGAVLLGAVGGPNWEGGSVRPEQGLLGLRKALDVYANLRPAKEGAVDLVIVRELVGGLYFGVRGVREDGTVFDTCEYHPAQVERIVRRGFELARSRRRSLVSVDKANVLDTSRLWRRVVGEVAVDYPDVALRHALVDSFAMEIVTSPESIDVVVTENMFGDILSDIAAAVTGGLGLAASASLGDAGPGIFEPVHGSAPDIAGTGAANPAAMLRSLALLLEHALHRPELAAAVAETTDDVLVSHPTPDLGGTATTAVFAEAVLASLGQRLPLKEEPWTPALS
ncbi:MAG TPA: 3-isopropylmalate dehydrogenase [Gaiellaceae bacterium]|nr:3-isopropylmalate dehydrogenase [Gaiellaceae bacterium]